MIGGGWSQTGLWLAVVASGFYHGVNPAMGWPLAVASGLMERSARALLAALLYLAAGHMLAMFVVMLPFAMLAILLAWQREIQIGASMLVIGFGAFLLIWRRHPRVLVRIPPSRLALWSFAVAIAHGTGLMLVPIYLGLCRSFDVDQSHQAARALIDANLSMALLVSGVHATAMILAGGLLAWLVYRYLGLKFVSRSWFNLDAIWASSLILVGTLSLALNAAVLNRFAMGDPDRENFEKIIDDAAAFEKFQARGRNVPLRVTVEARAICPSYPWLPKVRDEPVQGAMRAHVLQKSDHAAWLDYASQLTERQHLQLIR